MINLRNKETGEISQHYECTTKACLELCFANIECLLHIALADSDEHIRELGGEDHLLELMNGYINLAHRIRNWNNLQYQETEDNRDECQR